MKLDTVGIVATNSPDYLAHMLACLTEGRVAVPLRNAEDTERLSRTETTEVFTPKPGSGWISDTFIPEGDDKPAQVSFTSGTEGAAKAVLLSHGNLKDAVDRLAEVMEIKSGIREYIGVPVSHSFGYARGRAVLAAGGQAFIPAQFDLRQIRDMLAAGEINALSAVPSQWRIFLQNLSLFGDTLSRVHWVEIGSQPMSSAEKIALRDALTNARIIQHYGLTEASRTTLLRVHDAPDNRLESVGRAEGAVEIRVSDAGLIETRGPHVALGIDTGPEWHALGPGAWLTTGDRGHIEDGWLFYEGRSDDIINCAGIKLSPDHLEAKMREIVRDAGEFAVLRRPDSLRGDGLMLALGPDAGDAEALRQALEDAAREMGVNAAGAVETRHIDNLARTETGKVRRAALAHALDTPTSAPHTSAAAGGFAAEIADILGVCDANLGATFHGLGGDSLMHMQMTLALERVFGRAPANWESLPLSDLATRADTALIAGGTRVTRELPSLPDGSCNMNPEGINFWALVHEDFRTNDASLGHQGFWMLFIHRFGNWRMDVRPKLLRAPLSIIYKVLNKLAQILFGMKLDYTVKVGRRVKLEHFGGMILGGREIGDDTILRQNTTIGIRSTDEIRAKPVIGRSVDIGAGAVIVGDITIGDNSIIGANSVVYMNVPPHSVVMGVPGKIIGTNPRQNPSPLGMRS
ncbi:AMP-binding protein [Roseovarius sp.]|uniref:AMP-binding protein n=1 Tax=Roseovarius sp. TaxID=1486281 RepID=UPI0035697FC7